MADFMIRSPSAVTSPGVLAALIPAITTVMLTIPLPTAPPILLIKGWTEKVTLSFLLPSFHWPYSIVSVRNTSIRS